MIITADALSGIRSGFSMAFNKGFEGVDSIWARIAMKTNSTNSDETYGWMEKLPSFREWAGPRVVSAIKKSGYKIINEDFELTISVDRNEIEDDSYGLYAPMFTEMGRSAAELPDQLVTKLLLDGFTSECYDGQLFFDTDHPVHETESTTISVSNVQAGSGEPWFLLDTSRAMRPLVFQERRPFGKLVALDRDDHPNVFMNKQYIYGSEGRGNVGYGLWQLAFGSKATLDATNYAAARAAMQKVPGENGRKLGIRPTTLVVGPDNESKARKLLNSELASGGESNEWKGTAELIVTPWLS